MVHITDRRIDPLKPLKWYKKLATKKGRLESGAFLVEGNRAIKQIIGRQPGGSSPNPAERVYRRISQSGQTKAGQDSALSQYLFENAGGQQNREEKLVGA